MSEAKSEAMRGRARFVASPQGRTMGCGSRVGEKLPLAWPDAADAAAGRHELRLAL